MPIPKKCDKCGRPCSWPAELCQACLAQCPPKEEAPVVSVADGCIRPALTWLLIGVMVIASVLFWPLAIVCLLILIMLWMMGGDGDE